MENRKFVILLLIIFGVGFFRPVFTYKTSAHANITSVMFDYYNKNFPNQQISEEFKSLLVEGSVREDDPPRWLNHFYDPINNKGLSWNNLSWESSKSWVQNEKTQLALVYKMNLASVLGFGSEPLIFTWQKAVKAYNDGDKKSAFLILGHILHLLEDASVPDHTRNDAHADGSPYEEFTSSLIPTMPEKKPVVLNTLDDYFDAMANYSNNNFYSRDTISEEFYKDPKPDYISRDDKYSYGFKLNEYGQAYRLVIYTNSNKYEWDLSGPSLSGKDNGKILTDYWSHLSLKSIQYGAGVIDLFFKEAAAAKIANQKKSVVPVAQAAGGDNFLASAFDAFKSLITNSTTEGFEEVAVLDLNTKKVETKINENIRKSDFLNIDDNLGKSDFQAENSATAAPAPIVPETKVCLWDSGAQPPKRTPLIINEVNWQGSETSTSDEWIELKNIWTSDVDILNWQLVSQSGNLKLKLSGKVSAGNFTVLKRGTDYKGALKNSADGLRLFDNECNLLDEVLATPNWPAGNNVEKRSAERAADFSWHNGNLSSPGAENSPSASSGQVSPPPGSSSGGSVSSSVAPVVPPTLSPSSTTTSTPIEIVSNSGKVLISEILFDAEGSDGEKEFIELYNPNSVSVDISSWSIQHKSASSSSTSKKNFEDGSVIAPKSFFLIWLGSDSRGDLKWLSGSLNNTAATISLNSNGEVIDSVSYSKETLFASSGQSLERKALENGLVLSSSNGQCVSAQQAGEFLGNGCDSDSISDWEIRPIPNPQNKNNLAEPRDPPLAVQNFRADFSSPTMELILNWDSSASSLVSSTPNYQIVSDHDLNFVISTTATSTKITINEVGKEYKFSIQTSDQDGLSSVIEETTITPKFLNNLHFYTNPSSSETFIEIKTDSYPFIPDLFASGLRWKLMNFYLNGDINNPLIIQYKNCSGQITDNGTVTLPDISLFCTNDGGAYSDGLNSQYIEDNNLLLKLTPNASTTFSTTNYITVVYNSFHHSAPSDGRITYFEKVATDAQKYYFQENIPPHQSPQLSGELEIEYREDESLIIVRWPQAKDPDSVDAFLIYEIK